MVIPQAIDVVKVLVGTCGLVGLIAPGQEIKTEWANITAGRIVRGIYEGDSAMSRFVQGGTFPL